MIPPRLVAGVLVAITFFLACGTASAAGYDRSHTGPQIVGDASSALRSIHSAHVAIQGNYQGSASEFDGDIENQNISGTITLGTAGKLRMMVLAGQISLHGPLLLAFFAVAHSSLRAEVGGKGIGMPDGPIP